MATTSFTNRITLSNKEAKKLCDILSSRKPVKGITKVENKVLKGNEITKLLEKKK